MTCLEINKNFLFNNLYFNDPPTDGQFRVYFDEIEVLFTRIVLLIKRCKYVTTS